MSVRSERILNTGAARSFGADAARQAACADARLAVVGLEPEKLQAMAVVSAFRQFFMGAVWAFFVKRQTRISVPKVEQEVKALGRSGGASSMGTQLWLKA